MVKKVFKLRSHMFDEYNILTNLPKTHRNLVLKDERLPRKWSVVSNLQLRIPQENLGVSLGVSTSSFFQDPSIFPVQQKDSNRWSHKGGSLCNSFLEEQSLL